jgi:hypothetical protein
MSSPRNERSRQTLARLTASDQPQQRKDLGMTFGSNVAIPPRKSMGGKPCFVYVIGRVGGANVCKVGLSDNPESRLKSLQSGSPHQLYISFALWTPSRAEALAVETFAHDLMRPAKMVGEWFRVAPSAGEVVAKVSQHLIKNPPCSTKLAFIRDAFSRVEHQA